jgi:predicted alpha-1,2-mannosidase
MAEDAEKFRKSSQSYRIYMDKETGFARGRLADSSWRTPFNPFETIHQGNDYCEGNAWQYSFLAPQDVDWLIDFYGGREGFVTALDSLFSASSHLDGNPSNDVTGLIGQYVHGNEPSHHIIYLYTMAGCPSKAADMVRKVMTTLYTSSRDGLCGNEDVGQMSAWYVLSALGFYQVEPASTRFWFGSPIVNKASVNVGGGKTFTVIAHDNSEENKYIQSIKLNGKPYSLPFIDYKDIKAGARLEFEMGPDPAVWY